MTYKMKKHNFGLYAGSCLLLFTVSIGVGIIVAYLIHGQDPDCAIVRFKRSVAELEKIEECEHHTGVVNKDQSVFESFTSAEIAKVLSFIYRNRLIVSQGRRNYRSNYTLSISLYPFEKQKVDDYYKERNKQSERAEPPDRYAFVRMSRGALDEPDIMEYKIGPLGASINRMEYTELMKPGEVPINARTNDRMEFEIQAMKIYITGELSSLLELSRESFDEASIPNDFIFRYVDPPGIEKEERSRRYTSNLRVPNTRVAFDLFPASLYFTYNSTDINPDKWHTHSFYYLNQGPYKNASALAEAYQKDHVRKVKMEEGFRSKMLPKVYPNKYTGKLRENADLPPPTAYEPQGPRYKISRDIISWMDWEFVYNIDFVRGPVLHDVRFKGERILWELALSEVSLVYSHDSTAGNNILADTSFNLGAQLSAAFYNVECPDHGTLMNNTIIKFDRHTTVQATCIFEADGERALWRKKTKSFAGGLRESYLVVRTPVPVGNYDYTFEWHFHLDGSLKTMVHASGFLQSGFWDPKNPHVGEDKNKDAFGFRVEEYTHGSMHDHSFAYKVDLDILGTNNTFKKMNWKVGSLSKAHSHNGIPTKRRHELGKETYYMHWETPVREVGLNIDLQNPERWVVVNENKKNKWGVYRGYEIVHTETSAESLSEEHPAMDGLSYTKYHCAVTKYNETEMHATDNDLIGSFSSPRVSVDKYLNDEKIVNQDLVLWVSVGFLHVPTAEDFPETMQTGAGFWLRPFNYFDENPLFDMPQYFESSDSCDCERPPAFDSEPCYAYSIND